MSNLLAAWREVGLLSHSYEGFNIVKKLVLEKAKADAMFSKGCATALVNIIKTCNELQIADPQFLNCILTGLHSHFEELDIPWMTILLKNLGQLKCDNRGLVLEHFNRFANDTHKLLRRAYETRSAA